MTLKEPVDHVNAESLPPPVSAARDERRRRIQGQVLGIDPGFTWAVEGDSRTRLQAGGDLTIAREAGTLAQGSVTQFIPLLERGQAEGAFRSDVSATWLIAVVRAVVHVASAEPDDSRKPRSSKRCSQPRSRRSARVTASGRVQLGVAPEPALLNPLTPACVASVLGELTWRWQAAGSSTSMVRRGSSVRVR